MSAIILCLVACRSLHFHVISHGCRLAMLRETRWCGKCGSMKPRLVRGLSTRKAALSRLRWVSRFGLVCCVLFKIECYYNLVLFVGLYSTCWYIPVELLFRYYFVLKSCLLCRFGVHSLSHTRCMCLCYGGSTVFSCVCLCIALLSWCVLCATGPGGFIFIVTCFKSMLSCWFSPCAGCFLSDFARHLSWRNRLISLTCASRIWLVSATICSLTATICKSKWTASRVRMPAVFCTLDEVCRLCNLAGHVSRGFVQHFISKWSGCWIPPPSLPTVNHNIVAISRIYYVLCDNVSSSSAASTCTCGWTVVSLVFSFCYSCAATPTVSEEESLGNSALVEEMAKMKKQLDTEKLLKIQVRLTN